jgi:hypothetical protein
MIAKAMLLRPGSHGVFVRLAMIENRMRAQGAAVVRTGRTREKLTKVVSQFDQERSLIHVSDLTKPGR